MTHTTGFFSFCLCRAALRSREKNKLPEVHVFSQKSIRETAWADSTRERGLTHYHQITPKEMSCGHAQPQSLTTKEDEYEMPTWIFSPRLVANVCSGPDLQFGGRGGRQAIDYGSRLCFNICKCLTTRYFKGEAWKTLCLWWTNKGNKNMIFSEAITKSLNLISAAMSQDKI